MKQKRYNADTRGGYSVVLFASDPPDDPPPGGGYWGHTIHVCRGAGHSIEARWFADEMNRGDLDV